MKQGEGFNSGRTQPQSVRLSIEEHTALSAYCDENGLTKSELLRFLLRECLTEGPEFLKSEATQIKALMREVRSLGRNVNQIARAIHSGKIINDAVNADDLAALVAMQKKVVEQYGHSLRRSEARKIILRKRNNA